MIEDFQVAKNKIRYFQVFLTIAFLVIAVLHFSSVNNELNGLGGDNAGYIFSARTLANFEGYLAGAPGSPIKTHHRPVFSMLLAPVVMLFGLNFAAFHMVVVLTELIALLLLFFFFRRVAGNILALAVCLVFALNPFVNLSLVRILTEFPYMMFTAAALLVAEKNREGRQNSSEYFWLPALVVIAYFTRTAGLSFVAAFILYRLYRKQFKLFVLNLPVLLVPQVFWMLRARVAGKGEGYFGYPLLANAYDPAKGYVSVSQFLDRCLGNIKNIAQGFVEFLLPQAETSAVILLWLVSAFFLVGYVRRWFKKENGLLEMYVPVYLLMLVIWPVYEPRKLMPIMPFVSLYIFIGIHWAAGLFGRGLSRLAARRQAGGEEETGRSWAWRRQWGPVAVVLFGLLFAAMQLKPTLEIVRLRSAPIYFPPPESPGYNGFTIDWSHFREMYYWKNSPHPKANIEIWANYLFLSHVAGSFSAPDAVIIARKPTLTTLYSGRPALCYPFYRDFSRQYQAIIENGVDYILFDGMSRETMIYLLPFLQAYRSSFIPVAKAGSGVLLQVDTTSLEKAFMGK